MKKMPKFTVVLLTVLAASVAFAQPDNDQGLTDEKDPQLVHWQWVDEVRLPEKMEGPYVAISIPPAIFGKAQDDLRDLRLADAKGNRVPYVLRVLKSEYRQNELPAALTDDGPSAATQSYQVRLAFGNVPASGYNEIEIDTPGTNFHRRVEVFGDDSDKFADPRPLFGKDKYLIHYEEEGKTVDVRRFKFDVKQFRFLRVRVHADPFEDKEKIPKITSVKVRYALALPGKPITERAQLAGQEFVRGDGGPGTAWLIQLPDKMPCEMLTFELAQATPPSQRPYRVQVADPDQPRRDLTFGGKARDNEWRWFAKGDRYFLEIRFPETVARRLRLVLTDFANPPLYFKEVEVTRADRQLIFEKPDEKKFILPLRLYSGNPNVGAPNYALGQKLAADLKPAPPLAQLLDGKTNLSYEPPPVRLDQRMPWLVYVVLGIACAVLLVILGLLAVQAIRRHDQAVAA